MTITAADLGRSVCPKNDSTSRSAETAALRDFDPAYVRCGSIGRFGHVRVMSALPPTTAVMMHRRHGSKVP